MGGLHSLINFIKAISQHMENVGLDDVSVESGAFAQNSTSAMMEGKTYYRAVRGHVMAYEALCWIKRKLFQSWARERSSLQDLDNEIKLLQINTLKQWI